MEDSDVSQDVRDKSKTGNRRERLSEGIPRFFCCGLVMQKRRITHPCTRWASVPLSHMARLSFTFYIEAGSHKIVQAGLSLTLQPSQTELALILPQSPVVSSYSHRPALEGAAGYEGLSKWKTYWRACGWDKSALNRLLGESCHMSAH